MFEQLYTETLVKVADIQKSLLDNNCTFILEDCDQEVLTCTEEIAIFEPSSAPHTTVNYLNCT